MEPNADILEFANEITKHIDKLNGINTKVDYPPEYEEGYKDACVAIKNTVNTLANKWRKEK